MEEALDGRCDASFVLYTSCSMLANLILPNEITHFIQTQSDCTDLVW